MNPTIPRNAGTFRLIFGVFRKPSGANIKPFVILVTPPKKLRISCDPIGPFLCFTSTMIRGLSKPNPSESQRPVPARVGFFNILNNLCTLLNIIEVTRFTPTDSNNRFLSKDID
jgi:hypothetical protein